MLMEATQTGHLGIEGREARGEEWIGKAKKGGTRASAAGSRNWKADQEHFGQNAQRKEGKTLDACDRV